MSKPKSGVAGDGQIAFLLTQVGAQAAMRFAERLAPLGLTPPQAGLLRAVGTDPGRSQQALATQLGVLPSRLVALIDELEHDGLLERRPNPKDRRHHAVHLTDAGNKRLRDVGRLASLHGGAYLTALSPDERATLARLLGKLATENGLTPGVHPGYRNLDRQNGLSVSDGS